MSSMIHRTRNRYSFVAIAAIALAALALGFDRAGAQQEEAQLRVGTYEPQQAFQLYYRTAEFQQAMQELQMQAQQLEPEEIGQLQQQAERMQQELIENFQRDVERSVPALARESGVDIVAVEVVYSADGVAVHDMTDDVVDAINEDAPEAQQQQELPGLPLP